MEDRHLAYLRGLQVLQQVVPLVELGRTLAVQQAVPEHMPVVPVPDNLLSVLQDCRFSCQEAEEYLR